MEDRYRLLTHWLDPRSEKTYEFIMTWFPADQGLSLFDTAKRKLFLKRIKVQDITKTDLYLNSPKKDSNQSFFFPFK